MKKLSCLLVLLVLSMALPGWAKELKLGQKAPEFTATTDSGKSLKLQDLQGKFVILYFYPKDDTPGCTIEAKGFEQLYPKFQALGAEILGVSYDSVKSHQAFKQAYQLPFVLLADTDRKMAKAYDVDQPFFAERNTFIISPEGTLVAMFRDVNPSGHAQEVLDWLEQNQGTPKPKASQPSD